MPSLYDHPLYYDILFGWDRSAEAAFYDAAFRHYGVPAGGCVLEVGSGTAQVGLRLARRGWRVTGLDRSADMLAFASARAGDCGTVLAALRGDMTAFEAVEPWHALFNPLSSFRLLLEEDAARAHLRCAARALLPGGVYLLDLTFGTRGEAADDLEEWTMERDGVVVDATPERVRVRDGGRELTLDWHEELQPYAPAAFEALVASAGGLAIETCHPEVGQQGEEGISLFDAASTGPLPADGRAIVVLRRADRSP